jgi:hypothetical protein
MYLKWGTVGEKEEGMGRKGGGVLGYIQPGIGVDGNSRHNSQEGFQVSKRGVQGIRIGISKQKGIIKGIGHTPPYIYRANRVYIVLIKDCV